MDKRNFGKLGEQIAAEYIERYGFRILERNFRPGRLGEIDIIATENEYICFIEVKTRTSASFGTPAEAVDYAKRKKIKSLALIYLKSKNIDNANIRFDIVEVTGKIEGSGFLPQNINIIRSAY